MIPYFCATLAMLLWSRHSDKAGERKFHAALGPLAAAVGLLAFGLSTGVPCKVVGITITLTGIYCFFGPFWTLPTQFLSESVPAAVGIATVTFARHVRWIRWPLCHWLSCVVGPEYKRRALLSGAGFCS